MKNIIFVFITLLAFNAKSQTLIGINADLGSTRIINGFSESYQSENIIRGNGLGLGVNFNFKASKRFNTMLNVGFIQKNSTSLFDARFGSNPFVLEKPITKTTINAIRLDVGIRFNVLNKKNKLFVELGLSNNIILSIQNNRNAVGGEASKNYETKPSTPYYVCLPMGIGYNYNNMFTLTLVNNPGLTFYDSQFQSRVSMYGINLCYYLPILGNKKVKESSK